jgi:hypothetical protein
MNSIRLPAILEYLLLIAGKPSGVCRLFSEASYSLPVVWQASAALASGFGQPLASLERPDTEAAQPRHPWPSPLQHSSQVTHPTQATRPLDFTPKSQFFAY